MRQLSIKQRVTVVHAALTLAVLVLSATAVYVMTMRWIFGENERKHLDLSSQEVFAQLKKGVLVDFDGKAGPFAAVRPVSNQWALVRGDGSIVVSSPWLDGISADQLVRVIANGGGDLAVEDDKIVGCIPAPKYRLGQFEDLPEPVRDRVVKEYPNGVYLRSVSELEKGRGAKEITLLLGDRIVEMTIWNDGDLDELEDEDPLPSRLPMDLQELLAARGVPADSAIVEWRSHDSQLLAVLDRSGSGARSRIGVNRYGEVFAVHDSGEVSGPEIATSVWLLATISGENVSAARTSLLAVLFLGVPIVWFLIVFIGWLVTRSALNPVRRIIDSASRIDPGHMQDRLPVGEVDDELARISVTINRMLDRLQDGFEREKQFAGDASHELRGPLAKILADIDVTLSSQREPAAYLQALRRCRRYARSLQQIADSLLLLTTLDRKSATTVTREVDVAELLMDSVSVLGEGRRSRVGVAIEESPAPLIVRGEPGLLQVALQNLLRNSLRYSPSAEPVDVHVSRTPRGVSIEVRDQGPGIPEGQLERVFERFARLDNSRSRETGGVGLGLSIVKEIVRVHGGSVELRNNPGGGLVATIVIPGAQDMPAPPLGSPTLSS